MYFMLWWPLVLFIEFILFRRRDSVYTLVLLIQLVSLLRNSDGALFIHQENVFLKLLFFLWELLVQFMICFTQACKWHLCYWLESLVGMLLLPSAQASNCFFSIYLTLLLIFHVRFVWERKSMSNC